MESYLVEEIGVDGEAIDMAFAQGAVHLDLPTPLPVNSYMNLRSYTDNKRTALVRHAGDGRFLLRQNSTKVGDIVPKGLNQGAFCDALTNPTIPLNVCIGPAGTGKTLLAMAYVLRAQQSLKDPQIILSKPAVMVGSGKAFGPVPGDMNEKYAPYLESFEIIVKKILGSRATAYLTAGKNRELLKFVPVELMRGNTYDNSVIIVDEFQNMSWHQLNTLISRVGQNSKLILLGDPTQSDVTFTRDDPAGMSVLLKSEPFMLSPLSSLSQLKTQYRSPICTLASDMNDYYRKTRITG